MPAIETARNFVNTWDCDENNHLNVQSYVGEFAVAEAQFRAAAGIAADALGLRRVRHVRYHRELVAGDYIDVESHFVVGGPHPAAIVHVMTEHTTGDLAATAIDGYAPAPGFAPDDRF
ncbi:MAG: thioesterase, partial [Hyphomicrobiales bacterium]|nr:thioesterase [Hyphomicrobiales bacterium]